LGIEHAAERLQRLIGLGDQTLDRLVEVRAGVAFLRKLRSELGEEAAQLTQSVCAPAFGGGR
jgi:hypothetical protein